MSATLQTYVQSSHVENEFHVHWRAFRSHGLLRINVQACTEDKHIVAELFALHHIIMTRKVMGTDRFGTDLILEVSSGAIRKLCLGISDKTHLLPWCDLLRKRMRDAKITVSKEKAFIETTLTQHEQLVCIEPPVETVEMYGVGPVKLSNHVLEQFKERNQNINYGRAMKQMIKELGDAMLAPTQLPDKVLHQKMRKYPNQETIRYYQNTRTKRQFVLMVKKDDLPVLLTAYNRDAMLNAY